jgi:hypothetical protein
MSANLDTDHDDQRQTLPAVLNPVSFAPWCTIKKRQQSMVETGETQHTLEDIRVRVEALRGYL